LRHVPIVTLLRAGESLWLWADWPQFGPVMPNVQVNRRAAPMLTKNEALYRPVRLNAGLGLMPQDANVLFILRIVAVAM
jgi:hypothetical protein